MFGRVIFVVGLASVPTALADLDLVRGAARSVALALAFATVVAGIGSLYRTRPATRGRAPLPATPAAVPAAVPSEPSPLASPPAPAMGATPEAAEAPGPALGREAGP